MQAGERQPYYYVSSFSSSRWTRGKDRHFPLVSFSLAMEARMRAVQAGDMVLFVDEALMHLPALVQHVYASHIDQGYVRLRVFATYPEDDRATDAYYSQDGTPGTWHERIEARNG